MRYNLWRDVAIFSLAIGLTIWLSKIGIIDILIGETKSLGILGIFIAGFFFTSILTVAPAATVLGEMAINQSPLLIGVVAGAGAALGDIVILLFIKKRVVREVQTTLSDVRKRPLGVIHLEALKFLNPILGAIIIASPLPDEIGLLLLGFSNLAPRKLAPLLFVIHSVGVSCIVLLARTIIQ